MTTKQQFKISGMHCTSCAMNIDGELEETNGVKEASTHYAKAITEVTFDNELVDTKAIIAAIKKVGYDAQPLEK